MRLKFQKSIQILLVVMLLQSGLLLLVQPMTNRLVLSRPSLLFISLFAHSFWVRLLLFS